MKIFKIAEKVPVEGSLPECCAKSPKVREIRIGCDKDHIEVFAGYPFGSGGHCAVSSLKDNWHALDSKVFQKHFQFEPHVVYAAIVRHLDWMREHRATLEDMLRDA